MSLIIFITMLTAALMMYIVHPVMFILLVMVYTITLSMLISTQFIMFWYGYILIMVFMGGMLILFLYIATIAPNEKFSKVQMISPLIMALPLTLMVTNMNSQITPIMQPHSPMQNIVKLYSQNCLPTIFLVMYLLVTLVIVVKITNFFKGPVRSN